MATRTRDHVPELAAALSVASLALVFAAALGVVPTESLPRAPDALLDAIPHVNAAISLLAVAVIGLGWHAVRRGRIVRHRRAMISGAALFAAFLALYLYKVALEGPTPFGGPDRAYHLVYLPVLAVHVTLAVACVPLLYYVLLIGLTHPVAEIPRTLHPRVGRIAVSLWLLSFSLGIVVYLLLYAVY